MSPKKENAEVNALKIHIDYECHNHLVTQLVSKLRQAKTTKEQQECLKNLQTISCSTVEQDVKEQVYKLYSNLYLTDVQKPVRTTIKRLLQPISIEPMLSDMFKEKVCNILKVYSAQDDDTKTPMIWNDAVILLSYGFEFGPATEAISYHVETIFNRTLFAIEICVDFLWKRSSSRLDLSANECLIIVHNCIRFVLTLLQKCKIEDLLHHEILKLIKPCCDLIIHEQTLYDTKANCGHLICYVLLNLTGPISTVTLAQLLSVENIVNTEFQKFELDKTDKEQVWKTCQIVIYNGITIVAPLHYKLDSELVLKMFLQLTEWAKSLNGDNIQLITITKALHSLSLRLDNLTTIELEIMFTKTLGHLFMYLDHKIDVVKNLTLQIFSNLINVADKCRAKGDDSFLQSILTSVTTYPESAVFHIALGQLCVSLSCTTVMRDIPNMPCLILSHLGQRVDGTQICECYETLMEKHKHENVLDEDWIDIWIRDPIKQLNNSRPSLREHCKRLIVAAFKILPSCMKALTVSLCANNDDQLHVLLSCVLYARTTGIDLETYADEKVDCLKYWKKLIRFDTLDMLKTYHDDEIRISVLAIIVTTQKKTEAFTRWELSFIIGFLYYNVNIQNASTRYQLVSLCKKAFERFAASLAIIVKSLAETGSSLDSTSHPGEKIELEEKKNHLTSVKVDYSQFWKTLFETVLLLGLSADSNYGRRHTCLQLLNIVAEIIPREEFDQYIHEVDINNLKSLIRLDTYEQNKKLALALLNSLSFQRITFLSEENIEVHINESLALMDSLRPIETISSAYMLQVCFSSPYLSSILKKKLNHGSNTNDAKLLLATFLVQQYDCSISIAKEDLQKAAYIKPIHGVIYCVRQVFKEINWREQSEYEILTWRDLIGKFITMNVAVSEILGAILYVSSPEGYLPEYNEQHPEDNTAKAQMLSVYAWRAIKEVSLFMGEIALYAPLYDSTETEGVVEVKTFQEIGTFFKNLLISSRHRGAFEQGAIGYKNYCTRLWKEKSLRHHPKNVLTNLLDVVIKNLQSVDACATRRSGGLPFMIQSILVTEPALNKNQLLHFTIKNLLVAAHKCVQPEVRIHSMNILRALYCRNQLGDAVIHYAALGMIVAINGFSDADWGIRNSSTLLFSSLMVRIFGVQRTKHLDEISIKNKLSARTFFLRYPRLYGFLLQKLKTGVTEKHSSSLYPVLLILNRLYPSHLEESSPYKLEVFLPYIEKCLFNCVCRTRELAAQTFASLIDNSKARRIVDECFGRLSDVTLSDTLCHGTLLQVQYLLKYVPIEQLPIAKYITETQCIFASVGLRSSHLTGSSYLGILMKLMTKLQVNVEDHGQLLDDVNDIITYQLERMKTQHTTTARDKFKTHLFCLRLQILTVKLEWYKNDETFLSSICPFISSDVYWRNVAVNTVLLLRANNVYIQEMEHSNLIEEFLTFLSPEMSKRLENDLLEAIASCTGSYKSDTDSWNAFALTSLSDISSMPIDYIQTFLDDCIQKCCPYNDDVTCALMGCIERLITSLDNRQLDNIDFRHFYSIIVKFSQPSLEVKYRIALSKCLVPICHRFIPRMDDFKPILLQSPLIWQVIFTLLEDDDEDVRREMSKINRVVLHPQGCGSSFVPMERVDMPNYTMEQLVRTTMRIMHYNDALSFLLSWILRASKEEINYTEMSEVFDKGQANTFFEVVPFARQCLEVLYEMLLDIPYGHDEKTVCIKQVLMAAAVIYDKLVAGSISNPLSNAIRSVLTGAIKFLENEENGKLPNLESKFKTCIEQSLTAAEVKNLNALEFMRCNTFVSILFKDQLCAH